MSIVSRRTVGQILLAYDDGASPPTDPTPLGSIVSVADGTLWVSLGGGTYTQASGGGALGDATIWPPVIDWPDLVNVAGPLRDGDRVFVGELNVLGSFGFAEYDAGIPQWRLTKGTFPTVTDMQTFGSGGEGIAPGALASIGTGAVPEPTYFYDVGFTQWVRTPDGGVGYIWQSANDWADLLSIPTDNLMASDLRPVLSLGFGAAYGTAIWNGSNWDLFLGFFESVADMNAFAVTNSIFYAALASVYPGAVNSELSVRFFWDGLQWVRAPDGIHYVWGQVPDWAALSTIIAPKNNDEVPVNTLGFSHSSGTAQRHGGSSWRLLDGKFETVTDLNTFTAIPRDIASGAVALIKAGGGHDEESAAYKYISSTWYRLPDGVGYIHPTVGLWANLTSAIDTPIAGDICRVSNLGYTNSTGTARYSGSQWELSVGYFATTTDRNNFLLAHPIVVGATIFIGPVATYFDSLSYRQVGGVPFTYTLSSLDDFSGVGLQDGDYGVFTPSGGGPILVRYVAACAYAAGTGTGTRQIWVHPDIYGRANLRIEAYVVGTETPPAYGSALQGYTYDRTGVGTISSVSGYMRLNAPAPGSGAQTAFMTSPAISGAKRFYVRTELRGVTAGSIGQAGLFNLASIQESQWAIASQRNVNTGAFFPVFWNGAAWQAAMIVTAVRSSGLALPASTPWIVEGISSGGAITDMMETRIDGLSYCSLRRNFDSATISTNFNVVPFVGANISGSSSGQLDLRNHYVLSSD